MLRAAVFALVMAAVPVGVGTQATAPLTSPLRQFGANIGDDYFLATYSGLEAYWKRLDAESDRMRLVGIGRTEEGRTQWMAVVSSPGNLERLDHHRDIARRLALADGLTEQQARALASEGRAIVWIDGGQHATELLGAQQLIELVYQLVSGSDEETRRILRDVIVLVAHANPDGHALVGDWYMKEPNPRLRTLNGLPRLYQKYAGHDNNRDFFLSSQAETVNINRVLYRQWFPQVVYSHHQFAPPGAVMFAPPFEGPFSPFVDALVPEGVELFGAAMHARFAAEGRRGVTTRGGGTYSAWWNGGLRTTAYFHNQIGLLTETIGDPAPIRFESGTWRFRQSVDYSMTANRAVLDAASRHRETLLLNAYRMARNAIERGTHSYVIPSDQPDFLTATKFVDALLKAGVFVHRATAAFDAGGRRYPAGSYVVRTAQAFGPHVMDMFEPQSPPGPAAAEPYDIVGWTLAFQMGVKFARVAEVDAPLELVTAAAPPPGAVTGDPTPAGYFLSHHQNDAFIVVNRLLAGGEDVYWLRDRRIGGHPGGTGVIFVAARASTPAALRTAAAELGVSAAGIGARPAGAMWKLRLPRVGLWDRAGGAVSSGWMRWLLERYEFRFSVIGEGELAEGALGDRFDVLILPDDAQPERIPMAPLRDFVRAGGTLMLIGDAAALAASLPLGVDVRRFAREQLSVPGSVMRVRVDNTQPLAFGFEREVDVFFNQSPVFDMNGAAGGAATVAWFGSGSPLRSGWARGGHLLEGRVAVADAPLGRGRVLLFGPEIAFRAQPHGTFKFLFNGLHYSTAAAVE